MFLAEPPPSGGDLHFRIFGFPVRVHPYFWVVSLLFGLSGGSGDPQIALVWVAVVFVSILIHELGHAVLQRRNGGNPRIVLYGFGGLAISDDSDRSPATQILISLAGPVAGFLFAVAVGLAIRAAGHPVGLATSANLPAEGPLDGFWMVFAWVYFAPFESEPLNLVIKALFWVNIFWGLVNLLPIYPLDGGRVSRELCTLRGNPRKGIVTSLWISILAAAVVAAYALSLGAMFTIIFFAMMAYSNYQTLQNYRQYESDRGW